MIIGMISTITIINCKGLNLLSVTDFKRFFVSNLKGVVSSRLFIIFFLPMYKKMHEIIIWNFTENLIHSLLFSIFLHDLYKIKRLPKNCKIVNEPFFIITHLSVRFETWNSNQFFEFWIFQLSVLSVSGLCYLHNLHDSFHYLHIEIIE